MLNFSFPHMLYNYIFLFLFFSFNLILNSNLRMVTGIYDILSCIVHWVPFSGQFSILGKNIKVPKRN